MIKGLGNLKESLKTLKDLQGSLDNLDTTSPDKMMESMGIDMEQLNKDFMSSYNHKVKLHYTYDSENKTPEYAYPTDSGFDLRSNVDLEIMPFGRYLVPTGLSVNIPEGYEVQVRPKSGLAIKKGLSVLNTPGTVDQGYTGEIKVILINMSNDFQTIKKGDKIAQAVLCPVVSGKHVELIKQDKIQDNDRGSNGFGSTGN
jgi:dUTP pyrophosphatase